MDSNFSVKQSGSFPSRGDILNFIILTSQIRILRKDIERLSQEKEMSPEQYDKVLCEVIDQIMTHCFKMPTKKFSFIQQALYSFITFYPHFTRHFEAYIISQKLLDYLLLKDLFIPLFADISSTLLDEHRLVLLEILPISNKTTQHKLFSYLDKIIQPQEGIKRYLYQKLDTQEGDVVRSYDTIRHNLDNWINTDTKMELESILQVIDLIFDDIKISITREHLVNLFICAHMIQKAYNFCKDSYSEEQVQSLLDHFELLMQFHHKKYQYSNFDDFRSYLYSTFLSHIDGSIINRDFYFDSYFAFMRHVLYSPNIYKKSHRILEIGLRVNGLLYHLDEDKAFKYMSLFLPTNFFNKRSPQYEYKKLQNELFSLGRELESQKNNATLEKWQENLEFIEKKDIARRVNFLMSCIYFNIMLKDKFLTKDKKIYEQILGVLESEYRVNEDDPNICLLKTKLYAFSNEPRIALKYCKKAISSGKFQIGDHLTELIVEGMLITGKCKNKRDFNFFEKEMMIANIEWREMKQVYKNTRSQTWMFVFGVDEIITDFNYLSQMYDSYFLIVNK